MKVIKEGNGQKEWTTKATCTGKGNGGGGCGAKLLVAKSDLYRTYSHARDETETYVTFKCVSCGVETDIQNVPYNISQDLPDKKKWLENH